MDDFLSILIVDDEPEARELLSYMLQAYQKVSVVGEAGTVDEALELMRKEKPQLVLLDIQMPEKDGFDFITQARSSVNRPGIIFVTAFEHYAIQAIRNSVFDYIMKPVRQEELFQAIDRFRASKHEVNPQDLSMLLEVLKGRNPVKMKLNTRSGYVLIEPSQVIYCEADGNYTHLQLSTGNRETATQNLGSIEEQLDDSSFFRVSRSYLINLKYLSRVNRKNSSCMLEYQGDSYEIKVPGQKIKLLESNFLP